MSDNSSASDPSQEPLLIPPPTTTANKQTSNSSATTSFIGRLVARTTNAIATATTTATVSSFNSPITTNPVPDPTPPSATKLRTGFSVEKIYEFEAPQFYDFTKQSDPERGHLDEHWFDSRKKTPSSPDFHFIARTASSSLYRPKSATGKLCQRGNFSGSNGGLSFMNTPIGRGQNFLVPTSVAADVRSSFSSSFAFNSCSYPYPYTHHAILKKSATTENVSSSGYCCLNSVSSSDLPATILRSSQKRFREFGSDERKIISGFLSTPLLIVKTPGTFKSNNLRNNLKELPRSPLQKVTKKLKSNLCLFSNEEYEGSSFLIKETSSFEEADKRLKQKCLDSPVNVNETNLIEETIEQESSLLPDPELSMCTRTTLSNDLTVNFKTTPSNISLSSTTTALQKNKEHATFQAGVKARIRAEQERIEVQAAHQARKIQKLKAGPTNLPTKSTKPLTIPKSFQFGCDGRAQLKKITQARLNNNQTNNTDRNKNVSTQSTSGSYEIINNSKNKTIISKQNIFKPYPQKKFVPTVPRSPLFASKFRSVSAASNIIKPQITIDSAADTSAVVIPNVNVKNQQNSFPNNENIKSNPLIDLRRKLEYRHTNTNNVTIPKSPKLLSIHRNRFK